MVLHVAKILNSPAECSGLYKKTQNPPHSYLLSLLLHHEVCEHLFFAVFFEEFFKKVVEKLAQLEKTFYLCSRKNGEDSSVG